MSIYIECGLLHITYSISAELFISFITRTVFFLCSRCCFNNSRTPGAHVAPWPQVGCSGTLTWDLQFCLWNCYLLADVSNKVVTPFCVLDMASRGCKRLFLFDWFNTSFTFHISSAFCCVILCSGSGLFPSARCCHLRNFLIDWCAECLLKPNCFCKDPQTLLSPRPCCLSITASNGKNRQYISWRSWSDFLIRSFCIGRGRRGSLGCPTFGLWPFYNVLGRFLRISSFLRFHSSRVPSQFCLSV